MTTVLPEAAPAPDFRIIQKREVGRWIGGALALAFVVWLGYSMANAQIEWSVVAHYLDEPVLIKGICIALLLTVTSMTLGILVGVLTAIMRLSRNPVTTTVAWFYVWVFRGTPVYLQLLIWFNLALIFPRIGIPGLWEEQTINVLTPFLAATLALGLNQGAYTSEVVRAGLLSVDEGQTEASQAIGMTRLQTLRRIVLPQAMRFIVPPIGNEVIGMVKTTSLASAIGVTEILMEAQHIYYVNSRIMELLIVCGIWYLGAVSILNVAQYYIERWFARGGTSKELPPTPIERVRKWLVSRQTEESENAK